MSLAACCIAMMMLFAQEMPETAGFQQVTVPCHVYAREIAASQIGLIT
jgi:hypothetical protein